jgi:putative oxidoreductase
MVTNEGQEETTSSSSAPNTYRRQERMADQASPRSRGSVGRSLLDRFHDLDRRVIDVLARWATPLLRVSLGVVFLWFGALKIARVSPVADLVARTVYWVDPAWFVPVLGALEVIIGAGLLAGRALRTVLALFWLQMLGTFLVLVIQPDVAFQRGNPLLLTVEGEFVVKNLVLLSAGMVVGSTVRKRSRRMGRSPSGMGSPADANLQL